MIWGGCRGRAEVSRDQLTELAFHPITLGFGKARSVRGSPLFAAGELGLRILRDLVTLSVAMGTKITIHNGLRYAELSATTNQ